MYNETESAWNDSCPSLPPPPKYSEISKWIALVEMIGIISLNLTVILLLSRQRKPTRMAFFVQHLAVADFCVGLFYVMPECIFDRFLSNWEKYSCLILYGYLTNLSIFASTFLIVVLTIDRLLVVVRPLSTSTFGSSYRYKLVAGAWSFAVAFAIPYAIHITHQCRKQGNICKHDFGQGTYSMVVLEIFINEVIPVCVIMFCYAWIIMVIWRREKNSKKFHICQGSSTINKGSSAGSTVISSAKIKTIKLLLVIVIVYIASCTPLNVAQVMNTFMHIPVGNAFIFLHVLAPINSMMNPLVFLVFNSQMFKRDRNGYSITTQSDQI